MKLRAGRIVTKRGGHGVELLLFSMRSDDTVYWSVRGNSYCVVQEDDGNYKILSVNGMGEIRWSVENWNKDAESHLARDYFFEP